MTRGHATLIEKSSCEVCWNQGQGRRFATRRRRIIRIIREPLQCQSRDLASLLLRHPP